MMMRGVGIAALVLGTAFAARQIIVIGGPPHPRPSGHIVAASITTASTFDAISVRAGYTGDPDEDGSATMEYKASASGIWLPAYTPMVDRRATVSGQANPYVRQFRGSIVGLSAGTSYDVRVTLSDPDGVSGSALTSTLSTLATSPPMGGASWYVDDVGSNGDGSSGSPFNTIAAAITAASAGDTIHLRPGTYPAFTLSKSGTANAWLAIVGDDRDTTIISGGAVANNVTVGGDYVQIKNLRLQQPQHLNIDVVGHHHVWIDNIYIEDVTSTQEYGDAAIEMSTGAHHVYVLNSTILAPSLTAAGPESPPWESPGTGIQVAGAMDAQGTFVFKGNTITGGFRDCIGNSPETFGYSTRDNTDIANNTISGCFDDAIQMEGDDINLRIWGNSVTVYAGVSGLAMSSSYVGPVYVFRNLGLFATNSVIGAGVKVSGAADTFYFHNTFEGSIVNHDIFAAATTGQVLRNNIIVARANPLYCMGSDSTRPSSYDYNLYHRTNGTTLVSRWNCTVGLDYTSIAAFFAATGQEAHGLSGSPLFTNGSKHIDNTSPAYNVGVVLANFNDANSAWPANGVPDLGYYEVP